MPLTVVNNYTPPSAAQAEPTAQAIAALLKPQPTYDVNFVFPVVPLQSDKVRLMPFVPWLHLALFYARMHPHPEMFHYLPFGPFSTLQDAAALYYKRAETDPGSTWYCVVDLTRPPPPPASTLPLDAEQAEAALGGSFAGTIGLLSCSPSQSQAELGYLLILPAFQRTHVTTHACSLLLQYVLDPPSLGGLGVRRAQWKANAANERSVRAAERLGMRREAVLRWVTVLPAGKEGLEPPARESEWEEGEGGGRGMGRHTVLLGLGWDEWESGGREHVRRMMDRAY